MMKRTRILAREQAARTDSVAPSFLRASEAVILRAKLGNDNEKHVEAARERKSDGPGRHRGLHGNTAEVRRISRVRIKVLLVRPVHDCPRRVSEGTRVLIIAKTVHRDRQRGVKGKEEEFRKRAT